MSRVPRYPSGKALPQIVEEAEAGLASAQLELSLIYSKGDGLPKDLERATDWLNRAVAQGDLDPLKVRGWKDLSFGSPTQVRSGREDLERAFEAGDDMAAFLLSEAHAHGRGVPKDFALAFSWAQKACALNANGDNLAALARCHLDHDRYSEAIGCYRLAGEAGYPGADKAIAKIEAALEARGEPYCAERAELATKAFRQP